MSREFTIAIQSSWVRSNRTRQESVRRPPLCDVCERRERGVMPNAPRRRVAAAFFHAFKNSATCLHSQPKQQHATARRDSTHRAGVATTNNPSHASTARYLSADAPASRRGPARPCAARAAPPQRRAAPPAQRRGRARSTARRRRPPAGRSEEVLDVVAEQGEVLRELVPVLGLERRLHLQHQPGRPKRDMGGASALGGGRRQAAEATAGLHAAEAARRGA